MDRQLLLAKKEVTYGTDPVAIAANTVLARNVSHQLMGTRVTPNTAKPGVGAEADHVYGQHVRVGYEIPLAGHPTLASAPLWGPIMKACGWTETIVATGGDESVTYALRTDPSASDSMTLVWRDAKRLHKVLGWRGRVGLKLSAGQIPVLVVTGLGLYVPVVAGAALAHADATFGNWQDAKPVANGTTSFDFDGVAGLGVREFGFEQSENVKFVDLPEEENVQIVGLREFKGNAKFTTPPVATINFEDRWVDGGIYDFSMVHQSSPSSIVTINGRGQVLEPSYARDDDQDTASMGIKAVPSSLTTDDELAIVLTWPG